LTGDGSLLIFAVTSCADDFLGMRNDGLIEVVVANGLFAVASVGLVSFAAKRGGEVTGVLFVLLVVTAGRGRFFNASLILLGGFVPLLLAMEALLVADVLDGVADAMSVLLFGVES
jgi:hypothetical protein